jgi:hypothetical protein
MKLHSDDPRLSAYVIGELSPADRAEVERALATSPVIRNTVNELRLVVGMLEESLGGNPLALDSLRRERVLSAARQMDAAELAIPLSSTRRSWRPWWISGAAAAGVAASLVVLAQISIDDKESVATNLPNPASPEEAWQRKAREAALTPVSAPRVVDQAGETPRSVATAPAKVENPGEIDKPLSDSEFLERVRREADAGVLPTASEFPQLQDNDFRPVAGVVEVPLPLLSGGSSWTWIRRYIEERQALPPVNAVRIEEMLNAFHTQLESERGGLALDVEVSDCPWDSTMALAMVRVKNDGSDAVNAKLSATLQGANVDAYRLVGYANFKDSVATDETTVLAPGATHHLLIELRTTGSGDPSVEVALGNTKGTLRASSGTLQPWSAASADFRFASLTACFGKALRASPDSPEVQALRQHLALFSSSTGTISAERTEALKLMRRSLELMED